MTKKLYSELSTALLSKCPKVTAVGLTQDERAMVLATFPQEYITHGKKPIGCVESGVYELTEDGALLPVEVYCLRVEATVVFNVLARRHGWKVATNQRELNKLLKAIKDSLGKQVA